MTTSERQPGSLALRLRLVENAVRRELEGPLVTAGLGYEHWQVLAALLENPGQTMTELAASSVLPAATLTRRVDGLVQRALVIRRIDASDRRRALVALSSRGEKLARELRRIEQAVESTV